MTLSNVNTTLIDIQELRKCIKQAAEAPKACVLFQLVRRGRGYSCVSLLVSMEHWLDPASTQLPSAHHVSISFGTIADILKPFMQCYFCIPFLNDLTLPGELYQCIYFSVQRDELQRLEERIRSKSRNVCGKWIPRCSLASQLQKSDYDDYNLFWERG